MITVDLSLEEARVLFNLQGGMFTTVLFEKPIDLNGLKVMLTNITEYNGTAVNDYTPIPQEYLYRYQPRIKAELIPLHLVKTKEQLAAEKAVQSAKDSLKAAEAVLKQLKEK